MVRLIPRTRLRRFLLVVVCLVLIVWFAGPLLIAPIVTAKLQKMVSVQLNAQLEIGSLSYMPPYGVRVRDVHLLAPDDPNPDLQLLSIKQLDLKLAKLPFGSGPLVIEQIRVVEPTLHLVQTAQGFAGRAKPAAPTTTTPASPTVTTARRSDMFRLRHLTLEGGKITLEDRERPESPPMIWNDFAIDMDSAPKSHSEYEFTIGAKHADLANLKGNGSFDIDELWVKLDDLQTTARTGTQKQSALPSKAQQALERYGISGLLALQLHGRVELLHPRASVLDGAIEIKKGTAAIPGSSQSIDDLDARVAFSHLPAANGLPDLLKLNLERLRVDSSNTRLSVASGEASLDESTGHWVVKNFAATLSEVTPATGPAHRQQLDGPGSIGGSATLTLSAAGNLPLSQKRRGHELQKPFIDADALAFEIRPDGLIVWPKKYPEPIEDVHGGIVQKRVGTRVVVFENLVGRYGADPVSLKSARMPLPDDIAKMKSHWRIEEIVGTIDFKQPGSEYPRGMDAVLQRLRPTGQFAIGGGSWFEVNEVPIVPGEPPTTRPLSTNDPKEPIENLVYDAADIITFAGSAGVRPVARPRYKADYFFSASADNLTFNFLNGQLPATAVHGDATFSPLSVRVERIEGQLLGGTVAGRLQVIPKAPFPFSGNIVARNLQLDQLGFITTLTAAQRAKLSGTAALDSTFDVQWDQTRTERLNSIHAAGEFEIFNGRFWTLPILTELLGGMGDKSVDPSVVGEAAGQFTIENGTIDLPHVAVCAPAIGLIGSGQVTLLDKQMKLQVVAAPLGDWRDRLKQARLPIVSDVGGDVVSGIQQIVNAATAAVLYQFEVTGPTSKPTVRAVPAPALTEAAARLFSQMLNPDQRERAWSSTARQKK